MQAVPELVREREHAAPLARVVHQHIRMPARESASRRRRRASFRAAPRRRSILARRSGRRCRRRAARSRRTTRARSRAHRPTRSRPVDLLRAARSGRSRASLLHAEQARLERVEALRDVVAGDDRVDEALRRLVRDLVREVARGDPAVEAAQPVLDRALVQDRVQHVAAGADARPERLGDRRRDPAALGLVGQPRQLRQRLVERELLAVERDAQVREELVEEPAPGARRR